MLLSTKVGSITGSQESMTGEDDDMSSFTFSLFLLLFLSLFFSFSFSSYFHIYVPIIRLRFPSFPLSFTSTSSQLDRTLRFLLSIPSSSSFSAHSLLSFCSHFQREREREEERERERESRFNNWHPSK